MSEAAEPTCGIYGDYVSTRPRARVLGGCFVAAALVTWMGVGFDLADFRLLGMQAAGEPVSRDQRATYATVGMIIATLQGVLCLIALVGFVEWLYQARINLRAFGVRRLRYARAWAVAGFLVPVLNLLRPYQVLAEVWRASDPDVADPFTWRAVAVGWLPRVWWLVMVVCAVSGGLAFAMSLSTDFDPARLQLVRGMWLVADLSGALALSLAYFVVEHVSFAQDRKWGRADFRVAAAPAGVGVGG